MSQENETENKPSVTDENESQANQDLLAGQTTDPEVLAFQQRLFQRVPKTRMTWLILGLCVLNYLWVGISSGGMGFLNPTCEALVNAGADFGPLTLSGQWWRMLTCAFVHIGIIHFVFNMLVFIQVAPLIERLYGSFLFLLLFLGSAMTGSLLSLGMNPQIISAGASGAIFGLYGVLIAYLLRYKEEFPKSCLSGTIKGAIAFVGYNLIFGLQAGIDNWAHVGGLMGGFVFGLAAAIPMNVENWKSYIPTRLVTLVLLIPLIVVPFFFLLPAPIPPAFEQFYNEYSKIEKENAALEASMNQKINEGKISDEEYCQFLEEQMIPGWKHANAVCVRAKQNKDQMNLAQQHLLQWVEHLTELNLESLQLQIEAIRTESEETMKRLEEKGQEIQIHLQSVPEA